MDTFILKTLKRLKKDAPKRFKELRDKCDELIEALSENESFGDSIEANADEYFIPLQMACDSRSPRLMEIGLVALNYLLEHGYLRANKALPYLKSTTAEDAAAAKNPKILMDAVVETVSKCSDEFDDAVQLQVIKALLTAVTTTQSEVHEGSLLLAVRSCFHIHLISKNPVNKTTAKAALTQMLSVVNQRMENFDARAKAEVDAQQFHETEKHDSTEGEPIANSSSTSRLFEASTSTETIAIAPMSAGGETLVTAASAVLGETSVEEADAILAAADETVEAQGQIGSSLSTSSFPSILHKDAYLLFRALCKLSMKGVHDESESQNNGTDTIALQNKILSLELIFHILQHSGPSFRSGDRFVYAIRHYLCVSLLGNCTSNVSQITGLSLQIFVALMDGFKDHLKSELEVFVTNIFLRILESENTSFDHKMRVLEVFHIICTEPSALVEIFINYDCELDTIDLYRRLVDGFAKIAKNPSVLQAGRGSVEFMVSGGNKRILSEEQSLRVKGLEGLVIVLRSLLRSANLWQGIGETSPVQLDLALTSAAMAAAAASAAQAAAAAADGIDELPLQSTASNTNVGSAAGDESIAKVIGSTNDLLDAAVTSDAAVNIFDRKQKIQEEIELGILKFNLSSKKGLAYLEKTGHIEKTPKSVATFLRQYQDRLDKTAVGDYLGREREYEGGFCIKVLHEYVDAMDFSGMAFDMAIRCFLNGFRLPGEAQKIDRLMEKFAERYYLQNRDTFASADMAFILAFSTIMLQTNLHNPAIRDDKRMTKDQFIKQNKGISSDGELPDEMLMEIYDRIAAEPIAITNNDKFKLRPKKEEAFTVFPTTERRRKDAFNTERKEMVRAGEAMFKQKSGRGSVYVRANVTAHSDEAYARPMFEVVWAPILGVLSQILETYDDLAVVELCLTCFQYAIRLACRLDFPTARHTFINALAKFTTLDSIREMQKKNVDSIKVLLDIVMCEGDWLEDSWSQVLQCISQLARLQLFANGLHTDDMFFGGADSARRGNNSGRGSTDKTGNGLALTFSNMDQFTKLFTGPSRAETVRAVEECNAEMVARDIDPVLIDRIYAQSKNLSAESVLHFVRSLCEVSMLEISASSAMTSLRGKDTSGDASTPRVFSLQKLVEVADFNMGSRPRIAWANIWLLLAAHFTAVGVHENHALSMFAIDSLKQLSIKFLQKEELSNFNFQRLFLKPFEVIISRSKSPEIKDLVLRCIDIMIRACAGNIRSGWKSIFAIFEVAANQDMLEIANIAFDITERLMTQQFELLIFDFVELMNCLVTFVASPHTSLSLKALGHLARCADHLADGSISPALDSASLSSSNTTTSSQLVSGPCQIDEDASVFRLWWPLLLGLSGRVGDYRLTVRMKALDTLGLVLKTYGHLFSPNTWKVIFKGVLFPMIDSAKTDFTQQPESSWPTECPTLPTNTQSWIGTMALNVFNVCLELFQMFREKAEAVNLLPDLMNMIESCICQETESLAKMALRVYSDLIVSLNRNADDSRTILDDVTADLVCRRASACLLRNLCLDFGDAGFVEFLEDTPSGIVEMVAECPLAARRRPEKGAENRGDSKAPSAAPRSRTSSSSSSSATSSSSTDPVTTIASTTNALTENTTGYDIDTPFSTGTVLQHLPFDAASGVAARKKIQLVWGASLYSPEPFSPVGAVAAASSSIPIAPSSSLSSSTSSPSSTTMTSPAGTIETESNGKERRQLLAMPRLTEEQAWKQLSGAAMTSMVISLDFIRVTREVIKEHYGSWQLCHFSSLLVAMEASHWHARSFNENIRLRVKLQQMGFMRFRDDTLRLPHLLDQEVNSAALIVDVTVRMYVGNINPGVIEGELADARLSSEELEAFAEPWIERMGSLIFRRYISLELELQSASPGRPFFLLQHQAYKPSVVNVLKAIDMFSERQFQRHRAWVVPLLSQLVLCDNKQVRHAVSRVYSVHINPLVLR